jgi:HSP20 family molecular chaperone IbpA
MLSPTRSTEAREERDATADQIAVFESFLSAVPARYYIPTTDIFETDDALTVVMEIPRR